MSTQNFYNKNASLIFSSECEEWEYDDLKANLTNEFANLEQGSIEWYPHGKWDGNRNYEGYTLGSLTTEKGYDNMSVAVNIVPTIRSGYFAGVNLDFEVEYLIEGDPHESIQDIDFESQFPVKTEKYEEWVTAYLEKTAEALIEKVEAVFKDYTTPLVCVAVFSNGEAVYEKADNKRTTIKRL